MEKKIGSYSFIIGVIIAVLLGLAIPMLEGATPWLISLMIILGLIVGFLNVSGKQTKEFLIIAVALVIVAFAGGSSSLGTLGDVLYIGIYLQGIFDALMAFVVPTTIVVALKDMWALAQSP